MKLHFVNEICGDEYLPINGVISYHGTLALRAKNSRLDGMVAAAWESIACIWLLPALATRALSGCCCVCPVSMEADTGYRK